jgi:hypothetical protein
MKLRKFENFGQDEQELDAQGLSAQNLNDNQDVDAQDAQAFAGDETQEEETMELDEVVDKILAAIDDCGEDCDEQEIKDAVKAILADFHHAQEEEEDNDFEGDDFEGDDFEGNSDDNDFGFASHDGSFGGDDSEHEMPKFEGLRKFNNFK